MRRALALCAGLAVGENRHEGLAQVSSYSEHCDDHERVQHSELLITLKQQVLSRGKGMGLQGGIPCARAKIEKNQHRCGDYQRQWQTDPSGLHYIVP